MIELSCCSLSLFVGLIAPSLDIYYIESNHTMGNNSLLFGLILGVLLPLLTDQKNTTAESGQNVTLTCRASNKNIIVVKWSRADLGEEYVLCYRDEQLDTDDQHPSFKNRVDLQDRKMKDGDLSLILNNVTINDTGTYGCHVIMRDIRSWKLIGVINLRVVDPPDWPGGHTEDGGKEDGSVGLIVGLVVFAVLLLGVGGFSIYRKQRNQGSYQPPLELQPV